MALSANSAGTLDKLRLTYTIPVFYSTNAWIKYWINVRYRGGRHYVWCSEAFDGLRQQIKGLPPLARSSTPMEIYRELLGDIRTRDLHSSKIEQQRNSLSALARKWWKQGEISRIDFGDIASAVNGPDLDNWRPVIYVIPQASVRPSRVQVVKPEARAGLIGPEYIIPDLKTAEFDIIEPAQC